MFKVDRGEGTIQILDHPGKAVYELDPEIIFIFDDGPLYARDVDDLGLVAYLSNKGLI